MKLSRLIDGLSLTVAAPFFDAEITSVTADSRHCKAGSLFVAVNGSRFSGADFTAEAYARGARAFVTDTEIPKYKNSTIIYSKYPRKALAELCARLCGNPERKMLFVGITGTKGKTTTAVFLSKILDGAGVGNIAVGTLGVVGMTYPKSVNTTPDPTYLFPLFKTALRAGIHTVVLEVSSQALKDDRVYGIPFDCVAFTGIGRDHVGAYEHASVGDYIASKRKLFTSCGAKRAVINSDDPYASYMASGVAKTVRCGFSPNTDLLIRDFSDSPTGADFLLCGVPVRISMPGAFNAKNAALALALARELTAVPLSELVGHVRHVTVDGRFNAFRIRGVNAVVDYAHNSDSMREVTALARRLYGGRIICVFGSVGERSFARRRELAATAETCADLSVITSDNSGCEPPLSVCADIYSAYRDKSRAKIIADRGEAISYALSVASSGDTVLVLGRGHERRISLFNGEKEFSDKEYLRSLADYRM